MTGLAPDMIQPDFKDLYFNLRQKEGRIYSDEEVAALPAIAITHPHFKEWKIRERSAYKLVHYLAGKRSPLKILEVGCGNGWLSYRLSFIPGSKVTGLDINAAELRQAQRVFNTVPGLQFLYAGIDAGILKEVRFDTIILAACIQYFPFLPLLLGDLFRLLNPGGEIHLLDSPFYKATEVMAARERSANYYRDMGFPGMASHYFHHEETVLNGFDCQVLYRPSAFHSLFLNSKNPFPWFCIQKPERIP